MTESNGVDNRVLRVTMPDGSRWDVPLVLVAIDKAGYYDDTSEADELADPAGLIDWAENNMNWSDVASHASKVTESPKGIDYQEGWINGEKEIVNP